jgi:hypothetical protein
MATGSQKVKTPTGWNSTRGAWVKTASNTWKDVDQIYIKTPTGWNNASGQEATQIPYPYIANGQSPFIRNAQQPYPYIANAQNPVIRNRQNPYPYIANAQNPVIRNAQQPYPYIANAQNPVIRNAQQPYPYIANAQSPYIAQGRQPSTYQHRSPLTYQNPVSAQEPNIRDARLPIIYQHRSPFTYSHRSPFTYQHRSPFTYQNPVSAQQPNIRDARSPRAYQNPVSAQEPNIRDARSPRAYQNPVSAQEPNIRSGQTPFTYDARYPANATYPANGQTPFTYQARYPANATYPANGQNPFTYQARQPAIVQSPRNGQQPAIAVGLFQQPYPYTVPFGGGGFEGGCFVAGSLVWLADGSHAPIESIVEGQYVWSWNEDTNMLEPAKVELLMVERICPVYDISLSDGRIIQTTAEHPIKISELQGWGAIDPELAFKHHEWLEKDITHQLEVDSKLFSMSDAIMYDRADSEDIKIIEIKENSELPVYNVSGVHGNHNYFVNGLLVHNFEAPVIGRGSQKR